MTETICNLQSAICELAGQHGRLELHLERAGERTCARRCLAQPPLQLSRVRYDDPHASDAAVFTLLHLGGVLAGDRVAMDVELGAHAQAQVAMAAATQVYQMPRGDAQHTLDLRLGAGSWLAWLAQPVILFGGARFSQRTRATLAPGARLDLIDVLVPGRLARGECYQFDAYAAHLEIYDQEGRLLVAERAAIEPRRHGLASAGVLGRTPVVGSLYLLGGALDAERSASEIHRQHDETVGVATLPNNAGVLVRTLGSSPSQVHHRLMAIQRMQNSQ